MPQSQNTPNAPHLIESVAIVGADVSAWLSALTLKRALPNCKITVVELPPKITPIEGVAMMPNMGGIHQQLGIREADLLRQCLGLYIFANRYSHFDGGIAPFTLSNDTYGAPHEHIGFLQYWLAAQKNGMNVPLDAFSIAAAAAYNGRYALPVGDGALFSKANSGYQLAHSRYAGALKATCRALGVEIISGQFQQTHIAGGKIEAIGLISGARLVAELYIDATGADGLLINALGDADRVDLGDKFPSTRRLMAQAPEVRPYPAYGNYMALKDGWAQIIAMQHGTAIDIYFDPANISDGEMLRQAEEGLGQRFDPNVGAANVSAYKLTTPWVQNCIALGDTAMQIDPIFANRFYPVHFGLSQLMALIPTGPDMRIEARQFNAAFAEMAENLTDFAQLPFSLNRRFNEPYWDKARAGSRSDRLVNRLETFGARGLMPIYDHEAFEAHDWQAVMLGLGIRPKTYDPLVDRMDEASQMDFFQHMLGFIAEQVTNMPDYQTHLEIYAEAPRPQTARP